MKKAIAVLLSLSLGCATAASAGQDPASLARSFDAFWKAAAPQPYAQREALWDRYIEQPRQALYGSVVWETRDNPDWRDLKRKTLQARFQDYETMSGQVAAAVKTIEAAVPAQVVRFATYFPDSSPPDVKVLLAPNFDAKSGVMPDGKPVLALAADSLFIEKANLDILLPHELMHLWDARHAGIANDGVMPGTHLTLPLFAEGLATYVSTVVTPGHADGEYLLQEDLGALPDTSLTAAARAFLADAGALTLDPATHKVSEGFRRWFQAGRHPWQASLPNRAGYWLGLHVIRRLRENHSLSEIASWPPADAEAHATEALRDIAGSSPSVQAKVAVMPWPFPMSGTSWLVYELHLANTGSTPMDVVRLDAIDEAAPGEALAHWEGRALVDRIAAPGSPQSSPVMQPGEARIVYLEVPLRPGPSPKAIAHVVCFRAAADATATPQCETGGRSGLATQPLPVLAPPVRKGPWVAVYTVAAPRGHRRVVSSGDASTGIPQRFAIDWMLVGGKGGLYQGDETKVANWYGYCKDVLAVATGTVVDVRDGMAESPVLENRKYPGLEASGNFVSLSLGNGLYAHYEHLKPGSIRVRRGEHVTAGQVIGSLGYTGNSTGPHLHLHVSTAAGPMSGDGVPYLLRDATVVGRYTSLEDFGKGLPWSHEGNEPATKAGLRPVEGAVIEFSGSGK